MRSFHSLTTIPISVSCAEENSKGVNSDKFFFFSVILNYLEALARALSVYWATLILLYSV